MKIFVFIFLLPNIVACQATTTQLIETNVLEQKKVSCSVDYQIELSAPQAIPKLKMLATTGVELNCPQKEVSEVNYYIQLNEYIKIIETLSYIRKMDERKGFMLCTVYRVPDDFLPKKTTRASSFVRVKLKTGETIESSPVPLPSLDRSDCGDVGGPNSFDD